jgi:hypothetical protein
MFAQRESARRAQVNFHNLKHRRDSVKLPFARSAKGLLKGMHSRPQEAESCIRISCKECTGSKFD